MTKLAITFLVSVFAINAQASEIFATCEHVTDMAVLAKDNIPYWTANRNTNVQSCYTDIKEFITMATQEDIAQFNSEFEGQITIYSNDTEFAQHVTSKKTDAQTFVIPTSTHDSLTPVIKPSSAPQFFSK